MSFDIAKAEREVAALQRQIDAERERLSKLDPIHAEADRLHTATCRLNHTDMCGYEYESWPNNGQAFSRWSTKKRYVDKVLMIREQGRTVDDVITTMNLMGGL